jgi:hypothetical protein
MKFSVIICATLILGGCVSMEMAEFSMVSTKPLNLNNEFVASKRVTGKDMKHQVFIIPIGVPRVDSAIENALNKSGANYLTDVKVTSNTWLIPLIYGQLSIEVEGTPWIINN